MNTNTRTPSIKQQTLQALVQRIPKHHPGYVRVLEQLSIEEAGLHGELYFDSVASKILTPQSAQLKNLTLTLFKETFQIDSIIVTPQFILITEIKNMVGNLYFNKKGGVLTRMSNGQTSYFTCPLFQVSRHVECISHILKKLNLKVPVHDLVIYTNNNVEFTVKDSEQEIYEKIHRVEQFTQHYRKMKDSASPHLSTTQMKIFCQELLKRNTLPFWKDHVTKTGVIHSDLINGVMCYRCCKIALAVRNGWRCKACDKRIDNMLYQNIIEYFLIHGPTATTKDITKFLHFANTRSAMHYLVKLGFKYEMVGSQKVFLSPVHEVSVMDMEKVKASKSRGG
ncbi:hypothetical protein KP77_27250 [Jeotgalibacillus alimentarius]|uniref:NERD domain-containing protein n=1 Tax=Jeotgalibacillus alimentarius TaxID=135826 RepID=A0A0C2VRH7_9BACL|nr:nuclease-related domain-containing protein [Jeotgalibacillus alimentarius]KIL46598.1 hypothetical protein KP77_27250 [Jeotgalibacillus alimentarius]